MSLSGQQRKQLQFALIDAFPTTAALEQMLTFGLDKKLRAILGEGSLQDIVFKLIQIAEAEGWIEDLVRKAHEYNSGNLRLKAIVQEFLTNPQPVERLPTLFTTRPQKQKKEEVFFSYWKVCLTIAFLITILIILKFSNQETIGIKGNNNDGNRVIIQK